MLGIAGFAVGGVLASSLAASWQSSIGNVAAGSLFALLQSWGARGFGSAVLPVVVGALVARQMIKAKA